MGGVAHPVTRYRTHSERVTEREKKHPVNAPEPETRTRHQNPLLHLAAGLLATHCPALTADRAHELRATERSTWTNPDAASRAGKLTRLAHDAPKRSLREGA